MSIDPISPYVEPIRKSVDVLLRPAAAFDLFARDISKWWPLRKPYSVFGDDAVTCGIEPFAGGELYEVSSKGERAVWGRVVEWTPGRRLTVTWYPGRTPETAQTVDVAFSATSEGTRVDLEHRDWQTLGSKVRETRRGYGPGWDEVLGQFVGYSRSLEAAR